MTAVAHFSLWAPNRSGLFEFVKEQIKYEKRAGLDSFFIHSDVEKPDQKRFFEPVFGEKEPLIAYGWDKALECDIWVLHRSIPAKLMGTLHKKKNLAILHGTSEILMLHDIENHGKDKKFQMHVDFLDTFKKIVCITKSDTEIMKNYDNRRNKIIYIPDAIDTERFSPDGFTWNFKYRPSICSFANIRVNKYPSFYIWAMPKIIEKIPTARLNLFGIPLSDISIWKDLILKSGPIGVSVENIHGQFTDLSPFMRGADISLNCNTSGIFSRDSMESMSCGSSIVAFTPEHTKYACYRQIESISDTMLNAWEDLKENPEKQVEKNRAYALEHFSMENATKKYIDIYNSL